MAATRLSVSCRYFLIRVPRPTASFPPVGAPRGREPRIKPIHHAQEALLQKIVYVAASNVISSSTNCRRSLPWIYAEANAGPSGSVQANVVATIQAGMNSKRYTATPSLRA